MMQTSVMRAKTLCHRRWWQRQQRWQWGWREVAACGEAMQQSVGQEVQEGRDKRWRLTAQWEAEAPGRWEAVVWGEAKQQPAGGLEALEGHDKRQEATARWEAKDNEDAMVMTKKRRMATTVLTMAVATRLYDGDCTTTIGQQSGWPATAERNCCATHPRQQPINGDNLGRRRGESGTIGGMGQQTRVEVEAIWWRYWAPWNCLQTYLPLIPKQQKGRNLFCMHPGNKACPRPLGGPQVDTQSSQAHA